MHVTLNAIRSHSPCEDGWTKLLKHLGKTKADDDPLLVSTILESNGLDDALWCLRALPDEYDAAVRLLVCDIAERALRLVPEGDFRPRSVIDTARKFAKGAASQEELAAAWDAARAAARDAAWSAAWDAARSAAWDAAWSAAWAAARDAARSAAWDVARDAERVEQEKIFRAWLAKHEGVAP